MRRLRAHLLMFGAVAIWGSTFVLVKNALRDVSPLLFNLIRMTLAFLCLAVVYRKHWKGMTRRTWTGGAMVGLFLALGYQFQTAGLRWTTPSKSAFLTGLTVVIVPLFVAAPGVRSPGAARPRWNAWAGALLACAGILLLTSPGTPGGKWILQAPFVSLNRGDLLTLACAFGFALEIVVLDRFSRPTVDVPAQPAAPFEQLAMLEIGFSAVVIAVTTPLFERPHLRLTGTVALALGVTAILATAAAFSIKNWAQHVLPATEIALLLALEPVFAWLTSLVVLGEGLSLRSSLGATLILAGMCTSGLVHSGREPPALEENPLLP